MEIKYLIDNLEGPFRQIKSELLDFQGIYPTNLEEDNITDREIFIYNINEIIQLTNEVKIFSPKLLYSDLSYSIEQLNFFKSKTMQSKRRYLALPFNPEEDDQLIAILRTQEGTKHISLNKLTYMSNDIDVRSGFNTAFKPKQCHLATRKNDYYLTDLKNDKFEIPSNYYITKKNKASGKLDGCYLCKSPTSLKLLFSDEKCKIIHIKGESTFAKGDIIILGLTYFDDINKALIKMSQELNDIKYIFLDFEQMTFHYLMFFKEIDYSEYDMYSLIQNFEIIHNVGISCIFIEEDKFEDFYLKEKIDTNQLIRKLNKQDSNMVDRDYSDLNVMLEK
jgi:hypothetical protein